jgi:hypothetical protein
LVLAKTSGGGSRGLLVLARGWFQRFVGFGTPTGGGSRGLLVLAKTSAHRGWFQRFVGFGQDIGGGSRGLLVLAKISARRLPRGGGSRGLLVLAKTSAVRSVRGGSRGLLVLAKTSARRREADHPEDPQRWKHDRRRVAEAVGFRQHMGGIPTTEMRQAVGGQTSPLTTLPTVLSSRWRTAAVSLRRRTGAVEERPRGETCP